jgi:hypothetical protein
MTDQPTPAPETGDPSASHGDSTFTPAFDHPLSPKERMTIDRSGMPEQDALLRAANFREVNLGYSQQPSMQTGFLHWRQRSASSIASCCE